MYLFLYITSLKAGNIQDKGGLGSLFLEDGKYILLKTHNELLLDAITDSFMNFFNLHMGIFSTVSNYMRSDDFLRPDLGFKEHDFESIVNGQFKNSLDSLFLESGEFYENINLRISNFINENIDELQTGNQDKDKYVSDYNSLYTSIIEQITSDWYNLLNKVHAELLIDICNEHNIINVTDTPLSLRFKQMAEDFILNSRLIIDEQFKKIVRSN